VRDLKIYRDHSQRDVQRDIKKIHRESTSKTLRYFTLKRPTRCRHTLPWDVRHISR